MEPAIMDVDTIEQSTIEEKRRELLGELNDTFLTCREFMHAWKETGSWVSRRIGGRAREVTVLTYCTRCSTERRDRVHPATWELLGRYYRYPEGYSMPGTGFTLRPDVRAERFRRRPPADTPPDQEMVEDDEL